MPLAVGVVHLEEAGPQVALVGEAPVDRERVEDVPEDAGVGEHEDAVGGLEDDRALREEGGHVAADATTGGAAGEVVRGLDPREQTERPPAPGQVVDVDEPLVVALGEGLAAAYDAAASAPGGPTVLVALPPGVHHELGVFAFAVALRRLGVDVVYLGPDLPLTAWRAALEAHGAGCAVLGVPQAADVPAARDVVEGLAHSHPRVQVVAGGREQAALSGPGVLRLGHAIGPAARELADRLARAGAVRG